jgi:DNA-binding beta-propeller fold protein YncE
MTDVKDVREERSREEGTHLLGGDGRRGRSWSARARAGSLASWSTAAWLLTSPLAAAPPLRQLVGAAACVSETGGTCADGFGLDLASGVAVSPDGRSVYVTSVVSDAVAVFDRSGMTGALVQKAGIAGCVSEGGIGGCASGVALVDARDVAVSPDGRNVYVTSAPGSDAVAIFDRSLATGALTQKAGTAGCVSDTGTAGACVNGVALSSTEGIVVSPDGRNVYVAASVSDAIAVFDRDVSTGALTQKAGSAGCVSETGTTGACTDGVALDGASDVAISRDGRSVYVAANQSDAIAVFDRDPTTGNLTQKAGSNGCVSDTGTLGACADGVALDVASGVAIAAERSVYVASGSNAVAVFDRDPATGVLTQKAGTAGCISETGSGGVCVNGVSLVAARSVRVSPDGSGVYVTAALSDGMAVFDRDLATGALTQKAGEAACVGLGGCTPGVAMDNADGMAVSADGRNVYVAAPFSDAVAVLTTVPAAYDIDGDGDLQPLTDGLLLLRFLFGLDGDPLIDGAVDLVECTRCTAPEIESFIEDLAAP